MEEFSTPEIQRSRKKLSKAAQLVIFRRDFWLCLWCGRPVIFSPAMKFLELEVKKSGHVGRLAYYHAHGTREGSPLLDAQAATLDHVEAYSTGGACSGENLWTSCWKCNQLKSSEKAAEFRQQKRHKVKGKYGEPMHWDGLSAVFVMLAERNPAILTAGEKEWLKAIKSIQDCPQSD